MEDLILAGVTFAASTFILVDATRAGIQAFVVTACVVSIPVAGYLAYERERSAMALGLRYGRYRTIRHFGALLGFRDFCLQENE